MSQQAQPSTTTRQRLEIHFHQLDGSIVSTSNVLDLASKVSNTPLFRAFEGYYQPMIGIKEASALPEFHLTYSDSNHLASDYSSPVRPFAEYCSQQFKHLEELRRKLETKKENVDSQSNATAVEQRILTLKPATSLTREEHARGKSLATKLESLGQLRYLTDITCTIHNIYVETLSELILQELSQYQEPMDSWALHAEDTSRVSTFASVPHYYAYLGLVNLKMAEDYTWIAELLAPLRIRDGATPEIVSMFLNTFDSAKEFQKQATVFSDIAEQMDPDGQWATKTEDEILNPAVGDLSATGIRWNDENHDLPQLKLCWSESEDTARMIAEILSEEGKKEEGGGGIVEVL